MSSFRRKPESRVNVTTGKNWIPDQVRNDKVGMKLDLLRNHQY